MASSYLICSETSQDFFLNTDVLLIKTKSAFECLNINFKGPVPSNTPKINYLIRLIQIKVLPLCQKNLSAFFTAMFRLLIPQLNWLN